MSQSKVHPPAKSNKWGDLIVRTVSSCLLMACQIVIFCAGKYPLIAELMLVQFLAFCELLNLSVEKDKENLIGRRITIFPYVLVFSLTYALFGKTMLHYFLSDAIISRYHFITSFGFVMLALIFFVTGLTPQNDQYAYKRFTYSFCGAMIVCVPCNLYARFAEKSLFWFAVPLLCVMMNDTSAYFCGRFFGRHQLIKLSPNKTVEGFVGALILTPITFIGITWIASQFPFLYCARSKMFDFQVTCDLPREFTPTTFNVFGNEFTLLPAYIHAVVIALFASLISPFGGFFASGFKRSLGIKDFSHLIPGHGGLLDRIDCQLVNCTFAYLYYITFVQ
ncbi:phosphatidate cytidylyltransferase family protein [Trichomonas vaginalis G3]|uniref:Phosphatidate cytidylyltransferase n=1 Tax=Trichomonas vaginalis (strain ATCC PRA-98 / G3) TaxID=412133 RepID=A2E055_TRIV3|nr:phosphatidate cytidylyltransferase protein [Trichomonas vaginalis G3]EAY13974.1 phosphatidate cytidylyltransferase family protein [Trichomonas vaginalis G3]KAI5551792.1 phosphatidate cytidylyltransferase protein [Trichomonas vaginalis G3]|eukprot:XP_001326197.1 phosphatidate cytidylyltransferase family protein [Trichomonas vaginalis G3]